MASEWLGGAFTAVGTVLGAGATMGSGLIGGRAQRRLAEASHEAQIAEVRREAYAQYLTAVYNFTNRVREFIGKLEENADIIECDVTRRAYLEDWAHLQATYAPVLIAGPSQIEESAENLRFCLGDLAELCDGWYTAHESSTEFSGIKDVLKAQLKTRDARSKFISAVRDHVYG